MRQVEEVLVFLLMKKKNEYEFNENKKEEENDELRMFFWFHGFRWWWVFDLCHGVLFTSFLLVINTQSPNQVNIRASNHQTEFTDFYRFLVVLYHQRNRNSVLLVK